MQKLGLDNGGLVIFMPKAISTFNSRLGIGILSCLFTSILFAAEKGDLPSVNFCHINSLCHIFAVLLFWLVIFPLCDKRIF